MKDVTITAQRSAFSRKELEGPHSVAEWGHGGLLVCWPSTYPTAFQRVVPLISSKRGPLIRAELQPRKVLEYNHPWKQQIRVAVKLLEYYMVKQTIELDKARLPSLPLGHSQKAQIDDWEVIDLSVIYNYSFGLSVERRGFQVGDALVKSLSRIVS